MKMTRNTILSGLIGFALLTGCNNKSKEVEELRKELAELKANERQKEEKRKLQDEIAVKEGELEGVVFIVTKSRENVKMGLVTVSLFNADRAKRSLQTLREELRARADEIAVKATPLLEVYEKRRSECDSIVDEYRAEYLAGKKDYSNEALKPIASKGELKAKEVNAAIDAYNSATQPHRDYILTYHQLCIAALGSPLSSTKTDADGKFKLLVPKSGEFVLTATASREVGGDAESYSWMVIHSLGGKDRGQILLSNDNQVDTYQPPSIVERLDCGQFEEFKQEWKTDWKASVHGQYFEQGK